MPEKRNRYDREFCEGAVRIVDETKKPVAVVACDLGVNKGRIAGPATRPEISRLLVSGGTARLRPAPARPCSGLRPGCRGSARSSSGSVDRGAGPISQTISLVVGCVIGLLHAFDTRPRPLTARPCDCAHSLMAVRLTSTGSRW